MVSRRTSTKLSAPAQRRAARKAARKAHDALAKTAPAPKTAAAPASQIAGVRQRVDIECRTPDCKICGAALDWPRKFYCSIECFREADAARNRRRYAADPEKERKRARRYRAADPERHRNQVRRYREAKLVAQAVAKARGDLAPRTGISGRPVLSSQSMHEV